MRYECVRAGDSIECGTSVSTKIANGEGKISIDGLAVGVLFDLVVQCASYRAATYASAPLDE